MEKMSKQQLLNDGYKRVYVDKKALWIKNDTDNTLISLFKSTFKNDTRFKIKAIDKEVKNKLSVYYRYVSRVVAQRVYESNIKKYGTLTCYLCLKPIAFGNDCIEHKTPLSRKGTNERKNLDIACTRCNKKKFTKTVKEYRKFLKKEYRKSLKQ